MIDGQSSENQIGKEGWVISYQQSTPVHGHIFWYRYQDIYGG